MVERNTINKNSEQFPSEKAWLDCKNGWMEEQVFPISFDVIPFFITW